MRVVVLGAGVVGVTAAYELMRDGHEVIVVDREDAPAMFTSFANAGLVAPGHAYAWSSPKAPKMLLKSLFDDKQAIKFRPSFDPRLWSWSWQFLRQCTADRARANTKRKVNLCIYSQERLKTILGRENLDYGRETGGLLYLYRSPESFERGVKNTSVLTEEGLELRAISPQEAAEIEPALAGSEEKFAGAIFAPSDESGDAHVFTRELAARCRAGGVVFRFGETITTLDADGDRMNAVVTNRGTIPADAFVLSLGVFSPDLARTIGVSLPIYPIKGYSMTLALKEGNNSAPRLGGVDEDNLVAYARFGDRMRLTATAEFAGYDRTHKRADFASMMRTAKDLFPEAADFERPKYWAGLRPMTPTGIPIFGTGRVKNCFMNTGHGHMGWTMAPGSARIVADLVAGRTPEIDLTGMQVAA